MPLPSATPVHHANIDLVEVLDYARIILAPVAKRQRASSSPAVHVRRHFFFGFH
jgi:hypothetical protein